MQTIDPKTVSEIYDEINRLETRSARLEVLNRQSDEMQAALWRENIARKTADADLSAEQKAITDAVREKFITAEFIEAARGKSERDAGAEYHEIMGAASRLLGGELMGELFGIIGDGKTMKCP